MTVCPGHFGHIVLPHPVVNPLFVNLLVSVLQTLCMNCHRLRISPYYIQALFPSKSRQLHRIKSIATICARQVYCRGRSQNQLAGHTRCQFCAAPVLHFKQQGICIMARRASSPTSTPGVLVPAAAIFTTLVQLPEVDLLALGFNATRTQNHPCNGVLSMFLVLPPVSRPAMRTVNLKTGNPNHALAQGTVTPPPPPCLCTGMMPSWWKTPSPLSIRRSYNAHRC